LDRRAEHRLLIVFYYIKTMLQIHYIRVSFARSVLFVAGLALVTLIACSNGSEPSGGDESSSSFSSVSSVSSSSGGVIIGDDWPFDSSGETLTPSKGLAELELENVIEIEYKNGSVDITNTFSEVTIEKSGENVVVTIPNTSNTEYNFVLSGTTTNGSLKFYGDVKKGLYLNGVNITNNNGPAINIQKSGRVSVHLINGTENFLADGTNYNTPTGEQAKGAFFSEGKLEFKGSGTLTVKGKYNHAIVVDNDFEMHNGRVIVSEAEGDGVHVNDKIEIRGGILEIYSAGDAIQSEKIPYQGTKEWVKIIGGKIKAKTTGIKSHGITSEGPVKIDSSAVVQISVLGNGSKGIKTVSWLDLFGGKTSIKVSGTKHTEPDDESTPAGIKLTEGLYIEGGELTIKSPGSGAKGISIEKNATISAGKVDIEADDDGIKVKGDLTIKGGTVNVTSKNKKAVDTGETGSCSKTGGSINFQCGGF